MVSPGPVSPLTVAPPPEAAQAAQAQATDRFTYIERRLRELGSTYCLLETWGNQGEYYRFHCRMSVAGSANYTRHFEATDPDPLQAMSKVLAEVEAWRATPP